MPRVKIAEREDTLMETILGRKQKLKMTHAQLDKKARFADGTFKRLKGRHTDEWKLSEIKTVCYVLNIPIEKVRAEIRYV